MDSQLQDSDTEEKEGFITAFDYVGTVVGHSRLLWTWLQGGDWKWDDSVRTVHAFVNKQVGRAVRRAEEKAKRPMGDADEERRRHVLVDEMAEISKGRPTVSNFARIYTSVRKPGRAACGDILRSSKGPARVGEIEGRTVEDEFRVTRLRNFEGDEIFASVAIMKELSQTFQFNPKTT